MFQFCFMKNRFKTYKILKASQKSNQTFYIKKIHVYHIQKLHYDIQYIHKFMAVYIFQRLQFIEYQNLLILFCPPNQVSNPLARNLLLVSLKEYQFLNNYFIWCITQFRVLLKKWNKGRRKRGIKNEDNLHIILTTSLRVFIQSFSPPSPPPFTFIGCLRQPVWIGFLQVKGKQIWKVENRLFEEIYLKYKRLQYYGKDPVSAIKLMKPKKNWIERENSFPFRSFPFNLSISYFKNGYRDNLIIKLKDSIISVWKLLFENRYYIISTWVTGW